MGVPATHWSLQVGIFSRIRVHIGQLSKMDWFPSHPFFRFGTSWILEIYVACIERPSFYAWCSSFQFIPGMVGQVWCFSCVWPRLSTYLEDSSFMRRNMFLPSFWNLRTPRRDFFQKRQQSRLNRSILNILPIWYSGCLVFQSKALTWIVTLQEQNPTKIGKGRAVESLN